MEWIKGRHVLIRSDNTATVSHINQQGGVHSLALNQVTTQVHLWAHKHLLSLSMVHIQSQLYQAADLLLRGNPHPAEFNLHPQVVEEILTRFDLVVSNTVLLLGCGVASLMHFYYPLQHPGDIFCLLRSKYED